MEDGKNLIVIKVFPRISVISGKFFCLQNEVLTPASPRGVPVGVSGCSCVQGWKKGFVAQLSDPTVQTPQHPEALTQGVE